MKIRNSTDFPVFRRPRMTMGVGFNVAVLIWGAAGLSALLAGMPAAIAIGLVALFVHAIAAWFFRVDSQIIALYKHYTKTPDEYHAGLPSHGDQSKSRPSAFGKEIPL